MSSPEQPGAVSDSVADLGASRRPFGRSNLDRQAARRPALFTTFVISGFIFGIAYRHLMNPPAERELAYYLRSGLHGVGIALTAWAVQNGFVAMVRSSFSNALRRLSVAGEIAIRSLAMTIALVTVGVGLQLSFTQSHWDFAGLRRIGSPGLCRGSF
ncbi:MAG: hypothetical protein JO007_17780 [Alphaproteobacteria bacterium]|nr:hypothetical protein [Alphaproteobacteria bacterium]